MARMKTIEIEDLPILFGSLKVGVMVQPRLVPVVEHPGFFNLVLEIGGERAYVYDEDHLAQFQCVKDILYVLKEAYLRERLSEYVVVNISGFFDRVSGSSRNHSLLASLPRSGEGDAFYGHV